MQSTQLRLYLFLYLFLSILIGPLLPAQKNQEKYESKTSLKYLLADQTGGLCLDFPMKTKVYYNIEKGLYIIEQRVGNLLIGVPRYMNKQEYSDYILQQRINDYYKSKSRGLDDVLRMRKSEKKDKKSSLEKKQQLLLSMKVKSKFFETIFGGNTMELIPEGRIGLNFGVSYQRRDDPRLPSQNRSSFSIDIQRQMQLSLLENMGKNVKLKMNYDSQKGFAFANGMNLGFKGQEDDIIKKLEIGNVSMPLSTSLIQGAQSLFGVKGEFQFGKTYITSVFSQQQSKIKVIPGNAEGTLKSFKKQVTDYQDNQHYFLSHYFKNNYDKALEQYPEINSRFTIEKVEVWTLDIGSPKPENRRSIIAIRDLGENYDPNSSPLANETDNLYRQLENLSNINDINQVQNTLQGRVINGQTYQDYEHFVVKRSARLLSSNEYSFNARLGYLSLKRRLDDRQMLAVAFSYRNNVTGQIHSVGEFSVDKTHYNHLIVKLLKTDKNVNTSSPMWELMMKNIYQIAGSFTSKKFMLNVYYNESGQGDVKYLNKNGRKLSLLYALNLDRLNENNQIQRNPSGAIQPEGDGVFDFQEAITVNSSEGQVVFTKEEPFGNTIEKIFEGDPQSISKYTFKELYTHQKVDAAQESDKNRYTIQGQYIGKTYIGAIAQGSARVIMEGIQLTEDVDYTINYQTGDVQIINPSLKDKNYQLFYEEQANMLPQQRTFMGLNIDHRFSKDFKIGSTIVNYSEKPISQKISFDNEPVNNTILGINSTYSSNLPFLTRWIDSLPLIETKSPSHIKATVEAAYLKEDISSGIGGQTYIDNFDRVQKRISLMSRPETWSLGSTPGASNPEFLNPGNNDLSYGYNRGLLSWYNISSRFYNDPPSNISREEISKNLTRRIEHREIYTSRDLISDNTNYINTFDLTFYPNERGPYNFNPATETNRNRWGGIMRDINTTDFDQANIQYLEFWLMDPFADNTGSDGKLIFQLGNVSEDILKDGRMQYENGLSSSNKQKETIRTPWGKTPKKAPLLYTFETQGQEREEQDLGFDGLSDMEEAKEYPNFSSSINPVTQAPDPGMDNYIYHSDNRWDRLGEGSSVVNRYKYHTNTQGNSLSNNLEASTGTPEAEDIDRDYNMSLLECYYQYEVKISKTDLYRNSVHKKTVSVRGLPNGGSAHTTWYQIRIPLEKGIPFGGMQNLKSVNHIRIVMKGFSETTTLRFATMNLISTGWRSFAGNVFPDNENNQTDKIRIKSGGTSLEIGSVNIEQNGRGSPPYVLPPSVTREEYLDMTGSQLQDEASMSLTVRKLGGENNNNIKQAQAVYLDYLNIDFRLYKKLRIYVHAQDLDNRTSSDLDPDTKIFIRIGNDLSNYYEYEVPLKYTSKNALLPNDIWPAENLMEVSIQNLIEAKLARNKAGFLSNQRYEFRPNPQDPAKLIYVKGQPSVGTVGRIMIGVRNKNRNTSKNLLLWFNELKLDRIRSQGAYAALGKVNLNLANLLAVELRGSYSSTGFGILTQHTTQHSEKTGKNYQIKTGFNFDKFFPKKWGLHILLNYDQSVEISEPLHNPLENDIKIEQSQNSQTLKKVVMDYEKSTGYNINLSKTRTERSGKPQPWDPENFSLAFAYRNNFSKDIYNVYNIQKNVENALIYNFSFQSRFYKPFGKWIVLRERPKWAKYLGLFKEFKINPLPTRTNFITKVTRTYKENLRRDTQALNTQGIKASNTAFTPFFSNNFKFDWRYNIMFDLTKSLKLDFTSETNTLVNNISNIIAPDQTMVLKNFFKTGDPIRYGQTLEINYQLPLKFLHYADWIKTSNLLYKVSYQWDTNNFDTQITLGNNIQNSKYIGLRAELSFEKLYGKIPAFIRLNEKLKKHDIEFKKEIKLHTQRKKNKKGRFITKKSNLSKIKFRFKDHLLIILSSIKQARFKYTTNNISSLNGFLPTPGFFGQGRSFSDGWWTSSSPNLGFIFGSQENIHQRAIESGWITINDKTLNSYNRSCDEKWHINIVIEPAQDLRVELTAYKKSYTTLTNQNFNKVTIPNTQNNLPTREVATVETSFSGWNTIFNNSEILYNQLEQNASTIVNRLSNGNPDDYSLTNQAVLFPSFLSTYGGINPKKVALNYKRSIPILNWNITYIGLVRAKWFTNHFERMDLRHAYRSIYAIRGIQTNLAYKQNPGGKEKNENYVNPLLYGTAVLSNRFEPLLGLDLTLRNHLQLSAAYSKGRDINLVFSTKNLIENNNKQWTLGFGYIFKNLKFKMRFRGKKKIIKNDLNLSTQFKITDTQSIYRKITENLSQELGGQRKIDLNMTVSYNLSKNFQMTAFFEYMFNKYRKSTAYPHTTLNSGIKILFKLGN